MQDGVHRKYKLLQIHLTGAVKDSQVQQIGNYTDNLLCQKLVNITLLNELFKIVI